MDNQTQQDTPILISYVTGTYNRIDMLKTLMQSIRLQMLPGINYEFVICDGGSTDGTLEFLRNEPDVVLLEDGKLTGAISAFTRAAHMARGKYTALLNDDVEVKAGAIIPAIVHLENNMRCGAVAMKDNRPVGSFTKADYKTLQMEGNIDGRKVGIIYAQCGIFRTWLGKYLNWWMGKNNEMAGARTYAGDNSLSAQIFNHGYTVDEVPECIVEDFVANDELRNINYHKGIESNDSHFFYDQWPQGVIVRHDPQLQQQDRRAARIFYLPIYEPGWAVQKHPIHGKHGLREALSRATNKYGANHIVQEFDYLEAYQRDPKGFKRTLMELADSFKPDLILMQMQSPVPLSADVMHELRQRTGATVINWNGDQAEGGLASREVLNILRHVDLQLITNLDVVPTYEREGVKWAYWQIGYEESADDENTNATADSYYHELGRPSPFSGDLYWSVVYLASLRSPERVAIAKVVEEFGGRVFSPSDEFASLYNFSVTKAIYKRARVIISDNGFTSRGFVSNRLFQALAAGGGVVLQQHVDGLDELTGLENLVHYVEWTDLEHLKAHIKSALDREGAAYKYEMVAAAGTAFVREHFSFDSQVAKLMTLIKERLGESEQLANSVALKYVGRGTTGFGLGNAFPSGTRYEVDPARLLYVNRMDVQQVMAMMPNQWEVMEGM